MQGRRVLYHRPMLLLATVAETLPWLVVAEAGGGSLSPFQMTRWGEVEVEVGHPCRAGGALLLRWLVPGLEEVLTGPA